MSAQPRLFIDQPLSGGARLELDRDAAHYLVNVMRLKSGAPVRLFNGRDGEWRAEVAEAGKRAAALSVSERLRAQAASPDVHLYFAPVKRARTDFIVEKATELGASLIGPVMTRRTNAERVRTDRLAATAREAAEQTERLDLPVIAEPVSLDRLISDWDPARKLIFCDEAGEEGEKPWDGEAGRARPIRQALEAFAMSFPVCGGGVSAADGGGSGRSESADAAAIHPEPASPPSGPSGHLPRERGRTPGARDAPWAILIGPEGGFDAGERELLRGQGFVVPVSLGPRILRADTAAAAALSVWQAVLGDWS